MVDGTFSLRLPQFRLCRPEKPICQAGIREVSDQNPENLKVQILFIFSEVRKGVQKFLFQFDLHLLAMVWISIPEIYPEYPVGIYKKNLID